jgi:hypothetical protein
MHRARSIGATDLKPTEAIDLGKKRYTSSQDQRHSREDHRIIRERFTSLRRNLNLMTSKTRHKQIRDRFR